ncbi:hypothetical protein [Ereboglobus luteus]|uniref:hypothetical protein n=1 Tax=Ereboglobus luteus TaxID=1796921 RepID=UPI0012601CC0|nr:hypothetical protein [Ereboglobus luteus]
MPAAIALGPANASPGYWAGIFQKADMLMHISYLLSVYGIVALVVSIYVSTQRIARRLLLTWIVAAGLLFGMVAVVIGIIPLYLINSPHLKNFRFAATVVFSGPCIVAGWNLFRLFAMRSQLEQSKDC